MPTDRSSFANSFFTEDGDDDEGSIGSFVDYDDEEAPSRSAAMQKTTSFIERGSGRKIMEKIALDSQFTLEESEEESKIENDTNEEYCAADGAEEEYNFPDEDILQQYAIMAQYEASVRVKENTGIDIEVFNRKKKTLHGLENGSSSGAGSSQKDKYRKKKNSYGGGGTRVAKVKMPKAKVFVPTPSELICDTPPALLPFATNRRRMRMQNQFVKDASEFVSVINRNITELVQGTVINDSNSLGNITTDHKGDDEDYRKVRCSGCHVSLKAHIVAQLVQCPECGAVTSASLTKN